MGIYIFIYILSIKLSISFIPNFIHIANNFCLFFVEIFVMFLLQNVDVIHRNYKKWCKFCRKTKNHRHAQKASPLGMKICTPPQKSSNDKLFRASICYNIHYNIYILFIILFLFIIIINNWYHLPAQQHTIINIYVIIYNIYNMQLQLYHIKNS